MVAHITPSLPYIQKLASPSHAAFGALGFPAPPIVAPAVVPPASLSKTALKKAARKAKQSEQLASQHTALLAYLAGQGVVVPPHLVAGALTPPPQASSSVTQPRSNSRTSMTPPDAFHFYCFVHGWTKSHGWTPGGQWQGKPCSILHAVPCPYTSAQVNARDPSTGGNANVYKVRTFSPRLPSRVSPNLTCFPCLPLPLPLPPPSRLTILHHPRPLPNLPLTCCPLSRPLLRGALGPVTPTPLPRTCLRACLLPLTPAAPPPNLSSLL